MTQAQSKSYGGVKKKLMGAVCMLLVASIMVVSSTYAWFTLSTAPEITGITTSVGANGNLEMALLTSGNGTVENPNTFEDLTKIKSAVGDSMDKATGDKTKANITWGNLVDVSDASYGLSSIKLNPARATYQGEGNTTLNTTNLLSTAEYGYDGRVTEVKGDNMLSAIYADGGFKYTNGDQQYGVRAVGIASNVTPRQVAFNNAQRSYSTAIGSTTRAMDDNYDAYSGIATSVLGGGAVSYELNKEQITGMIAIAKAMLSDFHKLDTAVKNAVIATAAASSVDNDAFKLVQTALQNASDAASLKTALEDTATFVTGTIPENIDSYLTEAATTETSIGEAITSLQNKADGLNNDGARSDVKAEVEKLLGVNVPHQKYGDTMPYIAYLTGGALGTLAKYAGTFQVLFLGQKIGTVYAGYGEDKDGAWESKNAELTALTTYVTGLTYNAGTTADQTITDTYGYVLDMAFRTNAQGSHLKLQTEAANRVYAGEQNITQGHGSNMTFGYGDKLTFEQAKKLMQAIRVVFFDPNNGTIFGMAKLDGVNDNAADKTASANLVMDQAEDVTDADKGKIVDLNQGEAKKVSILVYLDGDNVDNSAVANDAQSGTDLKLNLQFSSSDELKPMQNSALKNRTA